jgi:hypothetical protein
LGKRRETDLTFGETNMTNGEVGRRRKRISKLTFASFLSSLIGGSWAWVITAHGGPEALGGILPLLLVGAIHLYTGPTAVFQAYRARCFKHCAYMFGYFLAFLCAVVVLFPPDVMTYVVIFFLMAVVPVLISVVGRTR